VLCPPAWCSTSRRAGDAAGEPERGAKLVEMMQTELAVLKERVNAVPESERGKITELLFRRLFQKNGGKRTALRQLPRSHRFLYGTYERLLYLLFDIHLA